MPPKSGCVSNLAGHTVRNQASRIAELIVRRAPCDRGSPQGPQDERRAGRASVRLLVGRVRVYGPTYSTSIASKQECHCHRPGVSLALGGARIPVFSPFRGVKSPKFSRLRQTWPPAAPAAGLASGGACGGLSLAVQVGWARVPFTVTSAGRYPPAGAAASRPCAE